MFKTPWNEKTIRQKTAAIDFLIGIFLGCTVVAYAISSCFNTSFVAKTCWRRKGGFADEHTGVGTLEAKGND